MISLTWNDIYDRVSKLQFSKGDKVWGIPRGGSIVAGIAHLQLGVPIADSPESATIALDDIIDSGATAAGVRQEYGLKTMVLVNKAREGLDEWIHFPWEEPPEQDIGESVRRIIEYIGDDPNRNGIIDTPSRVVKSWSTLFGGYGQDVSSLLRWFDDDTDEMIISKNIQFYSTCEHHMLPFFGTVVVGYIPRGKVLGISKLSRIVRSYASRMQIQERLTREIGELIEPHVKGVGVHIEAQHLCMMARGVEQQDSTMVTNYLTGPFKHLPETRAEFLGVVNG